MAVGSLIDISWTNYGNTRQSGIFFVRALSEKEQNLALVVEKYSLRMHKDPIGTNLVQKSIIVCLKGNLVLRLIQIFEFDGDVHFFVVDP